jgi:putative SOS response-associated peptidase YedK
VKPATWHWFALDGDEERPLFAFPGVWTRYRGPLKKGGENVDQEVFAFMTTEPNELTASINLERMPVLISDLDDFETWLSGSTEDAFSWRAATQPSRCASCSSARSVRICCG